uniref:PH01B031C15.13 protein n=1 Tax=Phyllostachys edulis TaxID=38705 RepID=L0P273_PHYED|nr:PH01B031C15.13 [Phyllostachys edulis]
MAWWRCCAGELLKEDCEKTRAVCEWCGARHLRSGGRSNPSGARCWFVLEPVQVIGLTSEEGLINEREKYKAKLGGRQGQHRTSSWSSILATNLS